MPFEPQDFIAGVIVGTAFTWIIVGVMMLVTDLRAAVRRIGTDMDFDIGKNDVSLAHVKVVDGHILTVWSSVGYHLRVGTEGGRDDKVWVRISGDEEDKLRQGE